jgi:HK97 gp10 family phage protein
MSATLKSRLPEVEAEIRLKVEAAIKVGAESVKSKAQARAPVRTGRLRDAIRVEQRGPAEFAVEVGRDAFYARMVEFGTVRAAPRLFLIPALEESKAGVAAAVTVALRSL